MKRAAILVSVLIVFAFQVVKGQGFNSFNERNHPELKWQVSETEHFLIMYPDRIAGIQDQAAAIAEATYEALSINLDIEFDQKIRIYLSDEDEINNGFAVPFKRPYTNIWVQLNDYNEIWTGSEKWLRKVIAHELAHIFHFEAVKSDLGLFQYVIANPVPSFWTEGLAQYETEEWDSQRGDRWLRKAIFDDDLNYSSGRSIEDGRLRYALGNSQLRYFTEKYNDSTLINLLKHREKLFGLVEYHDFGSAFEETIKGGYGAFYDDWRKHMNVYYNTIASQMERVDSLYSEPFEFPGQFYFDAAVSSDDSVIAILSLTSMERPVKRLHLIQNDSTQNTQQIGEGGINADLSWSKGGNYLYYSRLIRGENSSLINDIFRYDIENEKEIRLTFDRRARFPVSGQHESEIVYVVNEGGTGNLFSLNLETQQETKITDYKGDIQLLWPLWIESQNSWLVHVFQKDGSRYLKLIDPKSGEETRIDNAQIDNRKPILSPDGDRIAYVSLRDDVPNVFIYDLKAKAETRYTNVFTGTEVFGWVSDHDSTGKEHLLIGASESRDNDNLFFVDAGRRVVQAEVIKPKSYSSWTKHAPPEKIKSRIEPNADLITDSYTYRSFRNLSHVFSIALPYYDNPDDWGIFATTNWAEPLSKHLITIGGWISIPDPFSRSYGVASYINNQFYPTLGFAAYHLPENGQFYGSEFLTEEYIGGEVSASWPLDVFSTPYQTSSFSVKARYFNTNPYDQGRFIGKPNIPFPRQATVADIQFSWYIKKQRPWKHNLLHPLDGTGLKLSISASGKVLGADISAIKTNIHSYTILPFIGLNRFYIEGRLQALWGNPLPQNFVGFTRYDNISIDLPGMPVQFFNDNERVRGYREFVFGDQVAFGSVEYRIPFIPSLQTELLGLISFGGVNLAFFSDAGAVWGGQSSSGKTGTILRWGAGTELKNQLNLFGLNVTHSLGFAQPADKLFTNYDPDLYYRVSAVVPF